MSDRTKRLLHLAIAKNKDEKIEKSPSEDSDAYDTNDSDTDYIPSTSQSSQISSSDESYCIDQAPSIIYNLENTKAPLKCESDQIIWDKTLKFEYDNHFSGIFFISFDVITTLSSYFNNISSNEYDQTLTPKEKVNVYKSPYLIKNKYKKTICKFCENEIVSKHFSRHLERKHKEERQVRELLSLKPNSKEKKDLISIIRNDGNLDNGIRGKIIPKKRVLGETIDDNNYAICKFCKGFYKRLSLSRHVKKCFAKPIDSDNSKRALSDSLIYSACHKKYGELLSKLTVVNEIFSKMQADKVTSIAIGDFLIVYYGEDLLKKTKMRRSIYHISNKLRECSKFLIEMEKFQHCENLLAILKPENFDNAVEAVKRMSRYDISSRNFGAASLALHFRTTLTNLCDLATKLILRKKVPYIIQNIDQTLIDIERFKNLVTSQWAIEIGSLALKDLNEKTAAKPKLLPITEDIIKLVQLVEKKAEESYEKLLVTKDLNSYRVLAETTLISTVLHNRKRVGDVQYLEWKGCKEQLEQTFTFHQTELKSSLTENEKILTNNYKRIISIGKGSRPVTILIPKKINKFYTMLCNLRNEPWFPPENVYLFTYPMSKHWIDGCSVIRKYAKICNAQYSELLTSSRLRKHIATVTQLLNLQKNEIDQLAKFMGHTTRTHENFYKLPQDVYQVAKISKILQIMEKGNAAQFKNKTLEEIEIDMDIIEEESHEETINQTIPADTNNQTDDHIQANENYSNNEKQDKVGNAEIDKSQLRKKWTCSQKSLMKKYFFDKIKSNKALRKHECEEFLKKYANEFKDTSWLKVKTFIFNESRLEKK